MIKSNVLVKIDSTPFSDQPLVLRLRAPTIPKLRGIAFPTQPGGSGVVRLEATGGTGGYVYADVSDSAYDGLPPGLSLNSTTGMITGTPTTVGRYRFRAQVQDSSATTVEEDFTLDIAGRLHGENVTPVEGESLLDYSYSFTVTGNTGSVTWAHIDGTLPSGLSLSSGGVLSGTPSFSLTKDTYYFKVRATDSVTGDTLDVVCKAIIWPAILGFDTSEVYTIFAGSTFAYLSWTMTANGGKPPYTIEWDNLEQFQTITFDMSTKTFSGIVPATSSTVGIQQVITGTLVDALGARFAPVGMRFFPVFAQEKTNASENGTTVAEGPTRYNFVNGVNTTAHVEPNSDGSVDVSFNASGGGGGSGFVIPLFSGNASTKFGSAQKLVLGSQYFDPTDPTYGLGPGSTATLCMLLESTSGSVAAAGELFQKSGTGSPQIIAATSTTTGTTATLVTADVSAAFTDTSPSGIFCARLWTGTPNGLNQATCTGAWIEVTP